MTEYDAIGPAVQSLVVERGGDYKITGWCDLIEPDTAQVLARYQGRFYGGTPAITKNRFGDGAGYYVGTIGERALYRTLLIEIFRENDIPHMLLPQGVESSSRVGEEGRYQFFFNNTIHGQNFRLDGQKIHLQPFEMKILTPRKTWA